MLRSFACCRIGLAVIAAAMVGACGSTEPRLPSCWRASELKQGSTFRGTVLISGGDDTRPSMFPMACDGGVVADLPEGFILPAPKGPPFSDPPERRFFQVEVVGKVAGVAFGRPIVQLEQVEHVQRMTPNWLRSNGS
jgi:hypothetical protein